MVTHETRTAILRLREEGHGSRKIAAMLGVARRTVRRVLESGEAEVPSPARATALDDHLDAVVTLERICRGNLVRVHEELAARHDVRVPYSTLTRFCRAHKIGVEPPRAAGRYHFGPGREMQHDTSPHAVTVGEKPRLLQCASLVMCFSRRRFIQCYPRWNRFTARVFLTRALVFLGGAAERCMLDNSTVIVTGTGPDARATGEMVPFERHFGFTFVAHLAGDADRSGRVERPFYHVETNFYPGRTFGDLPDLNAQLLAWCSTYNATFNRNLGFVPDEMGAVEAPSLRPLPAWIPEPMDVHPRKVDVEGYIQLHTNRYSVPEELVGQAVEVHETHESLSIYLGHRRVCVHRKFLDGVNQRVTLPEHTRHWDKLRGPVPASTEETQLRAVSPAFAELCDALRARYGGQALKGMRRFHRMWLDFPIEALEPAVRRAIEFGRTDLDAVETMVIRNARRDFFRLPTPEDPDHG